MTPQGRAQDGLHKKRILILRAAYYLFLVGGILGLSYAGYLFADAQIYQALEVSTFANPEPLDGPLAVPVIAGGVIGEMEIPRLGLKVIFDQGDSPGILRRAVGHIPETALPGASGNVVLTGHRDTFFRALRNIQPGDSITLRTSGGEFQYEVESTAVVPPSDTSVLQSSNMPTLTLITCFPFYYVGPAPRRFIVRARQVTIHQAISVTAKPPLASGRLL
jgi:LPXTG-site transpeptidase (sortase) family protein